MKYRIMRRKKDYKVLEEQCLEIVKEQNILTIDGIAAFIPFPWEKFIEYKLDASKVLIEAINENRSATKQQLMLQWLRPNASPTCQIALFKLLASEEERKVMTSAKKDDSSQECLTTQEAYLRSLEEMGKDINAD